MTQPPRPDAWPPRVLSLCAVLVLAAAAWAAEYSEPSRGPTMTISNRKGRKRLLGMDRYCVREVFVDGAAVFGGNRCRIAHGGRHALRLPPGRRRIVLDTASEWVEDPDLPPERLSLELDVGEKDFLLMLEGSQEPKAVFPDAGGLAFDSRLHSKFQVRGCTACHDFFEKGRGGLAFASHEGRGPATCAQCHTKEVTGFKEADDWFARPGLYTSGMDARRTCEAIKAALHAEFKSESLLARELERHLLEDPRVLWAIEGATPMSGRLPEDKAEADLVRGGLAQWKEVVLAWLRGGMKCE